MMEATAAMVMAMAAMVVATAATAAMGDVNDHAVSCAVTGGTKQTTVASVLIQTTALATSALGTQPLQTPMIKTHGMWTLVP
jgi:hypothetical protein